MVFTVLVAADVYGTKGNFEVTFPTSPTLAELTRQTESIYGVEAAARRPVGTLAAPFLISRFQLYNERLQQWVDLTSPTQLADRCQVFAFQTSATPAAPVAAAASTTAAASAMAAVDAATVQAQAQAQAQATAAANHALATSQAEAAAVQAQLAAQQTATHVASTAVANHASQVAAVQAEQVAMSNARHAAQQAQQLATAVPQVVIPAFSETATHEDKARSVFDGLDTNGNKLLEPDELRQAFDLLHVDFSGATISDLIQKADLDRDGVISYPEWQRFGENFPTLIDSFYFRLKAYWEDVRRQQEIRASKEMLAELKERSQQAQVDWLEAQRDSDAARSRLSAQEVSLAQAIDAQRAAEQALLEGRRDVERATADCRAREHELVAQREREAQAATLHADCVRDTEAAQARLAHAQAATAAAQERERQAAQTLSEAQAEVERQRQLTAQRSAEVTDARSREQAAALAATEAVRDATLASERLSRADLDVAAKQQREKELDAAHTQSQLETQRGTARRDEEAHALQIQRQNEESAHVSRLDAQHKSEEADRKVVALEAENTAFAQKRRTVEEQEAPLLDQEIRLRSQRDALEEKEAKLRGDHRDFCEATRAADEMVSPTHVSPRKEYATLANAAAANAAANAAVANTVMNAQMPTPLNAAYHPVAAGAPAYAGVAAAAPVPAAHITPLTATPRQEFGNYPSARLGYPGASPASPIDTPLKTGRLA
eukprot:TRINITY_DN534_c2_g1_i1.p1 TRINITY_DN534_c2_g1~~TRINITY_DN534_c2_g1_i1.p1  ORF type:complete len:723 (+),score=248.38 TRINITY_DN534_c2_g1_i1:74-2242(+)